MKGSVKMGLDMYLTKKTYVQNWDHTPEKGRHAVMVFKGWKPCEHIKPERVSYIEENIGYWRKANAIHSWFVNNVQGGNDDCGTYYVPKEQLQGLLDIVNKILENSEVVAGTVSNGQKLENGEWTDILADGKVIGNPAIAQELLPTQPGFFFGGTDYDQYYFEDLKNTKAILESALKEYEHGEIYYHSSW